jgi:hypothetical protein
MGITKYLAIQTATNANGQRMIIDSRNMTLNRVSRSIGNQRDGLFFQPHNLLIKT